MAPPPRCDRGSFASPASPRTRSPPQIGTSGLADYPTPAGGPRRSCSHGIASYSAPCRREPTEALLLHPPAPQKQPTAAPSPSDASCALTPPRDLSFEFLSHPPPLPTWPPS